jgi:farnesyl diphosphate synthase
MDHNKPTYVSVLGLDGARAQAEDLRLRAHRALSGSGLAQHGYLSLLADLVVDRTS